MLIVILIIIGVIDWQQRRIPNNLVLLLFVAGCVELFLAAGTINIASLTLNILIAMLLTIPAYFKGIVGGGDVKLMLALTLSWPPLVFLIIYAVGVATTVVALELEKRLTSQCELPTISGESMANNGEAKSAKCGLPLGSAMAFGAIIYTILSYIHPLI